jgi:hypothetical protein
MAKMLSMPKNLRTDVIQRLVAAKVSGNAPAFCEAYHSFRPSPSEEVGNLLKNLEQTGDPKSPDFESLWVKFLDQATELGPITDPEVERLLAAARSDESELYADAPSRLYNYLQGQVDSYKETKLIHESKGDSEEEDKWWDEWADLVNNIGGAAERLWRDQYLPRTSQQPLKNAAPVIRRSDLLMLLWLEANFYKERCYYNQQGRILQAGQSIRGQLREKVTKYRDLIKQWDDELAGATRRGPFLTKSNRKLQLQQLRRLIRQFSNLDANELGWASQVSDVEAELRYQTREETRREMQATGHWLAALGLLILKVTTGYGTRPLRFLYTAIVVWLASSAAFFVNDLLILWNDPSGAACPSGHLQVHQWTDVLTMLVQYLYISATTLATMGSNSTLASYCNGASTQVVLVLTVFLGYFMLGLLGALLYTQLTQRD